MSAPELTLVIVSDQGSAPVLPRLAELAALEAFPRFTVSLLVRSGDLDRDAVQAAAPWVSVIDTDGTPMTLQQAVATALPTVSTRFVMFTDAAIAGQGTIDRVIDRGHESAESFGLADAPFPLLTPIGWSERTITDAYRGWLDQQHADAVAAHRANLDGYVHMLPLRNLLARLDGIDVLEGGTVLRITGMCRRGATDSVEPPDHGMELLVVDGAGEVVARADARPTPRIEAGLTRWTGFIADLQVDDLPFGKATLDIKLAAPPGREDVRVPVKPAPGALAASRPLVVRGRRFQFFPVHGSGRAEFVTQSATAALARMRWSATVLRRDLGGMLRRRPFAWTRPIRALTRPLFWRRTIWLVGERPDTARDNGYHLFAHLTRERPDVDVYYVIDRASAQYDQMSALGRVVAHSSWRHRLLMYHASVLVNAYSLTHMLPQQWSKALYVRHFAWRVGAFRVYLKHGIHMNPKVLKRQQTGFDLFLTASRRETEAARVTSGYDRQIVPTGLPRYDALVPTPPSRTILFMPTWRMYLVPRLFSDETTTKVPFEGSTYQRFMQDFLGSPRLRQLLEEHDYRLEFMPHYNMHAHLAQMPLTGDRLTVLDGSAPDIQDTMRRCDLFLTDHSSVHFDIAYLGTPLIYTHFDDDEYFGGHAHTSWFSHEEDGFGPVTRDVESTIDAIERYVLNGCEREPEYSARVDETFIFHDRHNSRRAVEAIDELLRTRGIS